MACNTFILNEIGWNAVLTVQIICIVFIHLAELIGISAFLLARPQTGSGRPCQAQNSVVVQFDVAALSELRPAVGDRRYNTKLHHYPKFCLFSESR
jgi:hypothetical protein